MKLIIGMPDAEFEKLRESLARSRGAPVSDRDMLAYLTGQVAALLRAPIEPAADPLAGRKWEPVPPREESNQ